jgi:hypothetical protein
MSKRVTVTLEEDALRWLRRKAMEESCSVSKLLGRMVTDEARRDIEYWQAYEKFKRLELIPGLAANPLSREEANMRPRYR